MYPPIAWNKAWSRLLVSVENNHVTVTLETVTLVLTERYVRDKGNAASYLRNALSDRREYCHSHHSATDGPQIRIGHATARILLVRPSQEI